VTGGPEQRRELVFMCPDTGVVVCLSQSGAGPRLAAFLASGETLWGGADSPRAALPPTGAGPARVRLSAVSTLYTGPAHAVRDEPHGAPRVPVSLAVTVEPAGVAVRLPGRTAETVAVAHVSGELGVGSVLYRLRATGWVSSADQGGAEDRYGCRARAVFQDRSAAFLTGGADAAAALTRHTEIRPAPLDEFVVGGPDPGPAHSVRCAVGGRSPALIAGERRDTEQHLTAVEPDTGGGGWVWWSVTPFVFVRSGVTGLGVVERTSRAASPRVPRPVSDLPDPF
jgi:hypothetical protein